MAKWNQATAKRENAQLDARLSDYSAITRSSAKANTRVNRLGNWPIYAAAAGSALAMATNASANIIYSGIQNITVTGPVGHSGNDLVPINLTNISAIQHVFNLHAGAGTTQGLGGQGGGAGVATVSVQAVNHVHVFVSANSLVRKFSSNAMISAGVTKNNAELVKKAFASQGLVTATFGKFTALTPAFAGLAIDVAGGTDYGWIRLVFTNDSSGLPHTLEAIDWAIDQTPGEAIAAGEEVAPTPEPGTMSLALLACGAAGVLALKRRRRQA